MELKVACDCGQKYKFDVEPVNGQMPFTVNCPLCGADGTSFANQVLAQSPTPMATPPPLPIQALPVAPGGLRINRPAPTTAAPPLFASPTAPSPLSRPGPASNVPLMKGPVALPKEFSMGLGILGAFLGSAVGGVLVFAFFLWVHFRFPLSGTAIGVLAGIGARTLARGTDNTLGFIAGAFALASVVGVFYMMYGDFFFMGIISIVVCVGFAYRIASG